MTEQEWKKIDRSLRTKITRATHRMRDALFIGVREYDKRSMELAQLQEEYRTHQELKPCSQ